jgi:hypothetical protein
LRSHSSAELLIQPNPIIASVALPVLLAQHNPAKLLDLLQINENLMFATILRYNLEAKRESHFVTLGQEPLSQGA